MSSFGEGNQWFKSTPVELARVPCQAAELQQQLADAEAMSSTNPDKVVRLRQLDGYAKGLYLSLRSGTAARDEAACRSRQATMQDRRSRRSLAAAGAAAGGGSSGAAAAEIPYAENAAMYADEIAAQEKAIRNYEHEDNTNTTVTPDELIVRERVRELRTRGEEEAADKYLEDFKKAYKNARSEAKKARNVAAAVAAAAEHSKAMAAAAGPSPWEAAAARHAAEGPSEFAVLAGLATAAGGGGGARRRVPPQKIDVPGNYEPLDDANNSNSNYNLGGGYRKSKSQKRSKSQKSQKRSKSRKSQKKSRSRR
jgi:hypothetical protein